MGQIQHIEMPTTYMDPRHFWKRYLYCSNKIIIRYSLALAVSISIFVVTVLNVSWIEVKDDNQRNGNIDFPHHHEGSHGMQEGMLTMGSTMWMKMKEQEFGARRARVKEVCKKYEIEERWKNQYQGRQFWFDLEHRLAFCIHPKVMFLYRHYGIIQVEENIFL